MSQNKKILISGAGIAGPTLAYWLSRYGFQVKIVEQAPSLRLGGQNIDISDAGIDILKMMGAETLVKSHNTTEKGLLFVDRENQVRAKFPKGTETSFTAEYEILRGDLAHIFYDLSKNNAEYIFGDSIEAIEQKESNVEVQFKSGRSESFDFLIGADGLGSKTREAVFGKSFYRYLHVYGAYMTIPRQPHDTNWARWYNAEGGKVLMLRPDNHGTIRASIFFWEDEFSYERLTREETLVKLRQILKDGGWESDRIARDMEKDPDIYFGPVSQIHLPRWSKGRCALVGDAAYCPTPFTGMGSTLAVIGAYVLAGELSTESDYRKAFDRYESLLRPLVESVQKLPPGVPRLAYPRSKFSIWLFNKMLYFAALPTVQRTIGFIGNKIGKRKNKFRLPVYRI